MEPEAGLENVVLQLPTNALDPEDCLLIIIIIINIIIIIIIIILKHNLIAEMQSPCANVIQCRTLAKKTVQSLEICGRQKMSAMGLGCSVTNEFHADDAVIANYVGCISFFLLEEQLSRHGRQIYRR